MPREQAVGEPPGSATELEHSLGGIEVPVLDEACGRTIFVERLRVLACSDTIVDAPSVVTR
jgi:hypothetical protein